MRSWEVWEWDLGTLHWDGALVFGILVSAIGFWVWVGGGGLVIEAVVGAYDLNGIICEVVACAGATLIV